MSSAEDNNCPILVYLDQNAWIELAKIEYKDNKTREETKLLNTIYGSVDSGKALFPISIVHFDETSKISKEVKRNQLATLMARLSKGYSISPYADSHIGVEVQQLVTEKMGLGKINLRHIFIKPGIEHLIGAKGTLVSKNGNERKKPPKEVMEKVSHAFYEPETFAILLTKSKPNPSIREIQKEAAEKMDDVRKEMLKIKDNDLRRRTFLARNFMEFIVPHIASILQEKGLPTNFILKEGMSKEEFETILEKIPTGLTLMHLTMRRDMQFNRPINVNDIADIWGLSLAIPYCDIVVTDKMMATLAKQSKLNSICNTEITTSIHDLTNFL